MAGKDHGRQVPESIEGDEDAQAVFGIVEPVLKTVANGGASDDEGSPGLRAPCCHHGGSPSLKCHMLMIS